MTMRFAAHLVGCAIIVVLGVAVKSGQAMPLSAQIESRAVTVEHLASTLPLPFAPEPTTAGLERIAVAPGASLDFVFAGPVLFYIEQGTLHVDTERHQLAIVQTGDQKMIRGDQKVRRGTIPAGFGVYSADGNPGAMQNVGDENLIMLAVLFVPQPTDDEGAETYEATAVAPRATPAP
jgi:hypothetical protein